MTIYSEIRNEISFDRAGTVEVMKNMRFGLEDFIVENEGMEFRFIHESKIDEIMQEGLADDKYVLGCCASWLLADILDIDKDEIETMQECELYSVLGKLVVNMGKLEELQQEIVRHDGYGPDFASYDGNEYEFGKYYAFRVN